MSTSPSLTTPQAGSASWQQKEQPKSRGSKPSPASAPAEPSLSVAQARLNWLTSHSNAWSIGKIAAISKWGHLTGKEAGEVYASLNHDYLMLEQALEDWPETDLQGTLWLELRERLQRWKGMLAGLWDQMQRASRKKTTPLTPAGEAVTSTPG